MSSTSISHAAMEHFRALAAMLSQAKIRADERSKAIHARFNVFTTLLSSSDEVRLHTRFLHCLLDPQGKHDCGSLFLKLFLATLAELPGVDHDGVEVVLDLPDSEGPWTVQKEASRGQYGQIDLLLERPGYGIAIENKIYAAEQQGQLARYSEYLCTRYGQAAKVLYLTLDGKESYTHHEATPYLRISYAVHILAWLEKCLRETYSIVSINQVLLQYREVVRQLTGKSMESSIMNDVSNFISRHPDIIRYKQQIDEGIDALRASFLDRLAEGIMMNLQDDFDVRLRSKLVSGRFGVDPNGAFIITPRADSPLCNAPFEIWVEHIAKWEHALVVGIESKYEKPLLSADNQLLLERMDCFMTRYAQTQGYHKADPQATWGGTFWPTGWHNLIHPFTNARLADLLETPFPLVVSDLCERIRNHIRLLEEAFVEASSPTRLGEAGDL